MTSDKSRLQLLKLTQNQDTGDYFSKGGKFDTNMGLDYYKAVSWELNPTEKGDTHPNEFYSIDGEKYPAQKI